MEVENILASSITLAEQSAKLDASCKKTLANKIILALMSDCQLCQSVYKKLKG
ncbi:MAG: hypothetical protein IJZ34_05615 [Lachnospiraceae bacterium]|nr:hypothetical protein [Lachnospiraceae bacterium]